MHSFAASETHVGGSSAGEALEQVTPFVVDACNAEPEAILRRSRLERFRSTRDSSRAALNTLATAQETSFATTFRRD